MMIRENVTIAAHENQQKYSMLDDLDRDESIQDTWKNIFVANRLGAERDLKDRMIAIRFIIQRDLVVRHFYLISYNYSDSTWIIAVFSAEYWWWRWHSRVQEAFCDAFINQTKAFGDQRQIQLNCRSAFHCIPPFCNPAGSPYQQLGCSCTWWDNQAYKRIPSTPLSLSPAGSLYMVA